MHACMHIHIRTCVYTCLQRYIHIKIYTYISGIQSYTHKHTHTSRCIHGSRSFTFPASFALVWGWERERERTHAPTYSHVLHVHIHTSHSYTHTWFLSFNFLIFSNSSAVRGRKASNLSRDVGSPAHDVYMYVCIYVCVRMYISLLAGNLFAYTPPQLALASWPSFLFKTLNPKHLHSSNLSLQPWYPLTRSHLPHWPPKTHTQHPHNNT